MKEIATADVAIIGGGITGLSTAFNLAKQNKKIVVIEKFYTGSQGSGRNAGGIRQQGRLPDEVPIVMEGMKLWKNLDVELSIKTEFRVTGNVFLASSERELEMHHKMAIRLQSQGLKVLVLNEVDMRKLIPALKKGVCFGGSYCPSDGMANPLTTTFGFAMAARRKGVEILQHTEVTDILIKDGRVDSIVTDKGFVKCDVAVIAAGSWSREICRSAQLDLPINPCRNQMVVTECIPPLVEPFMLTSNVYCNQTMDGSMIIGNVDPDDYCTSSNANVNENKKIAKNILKYLPILNEVSIVRSWGGPLDLTPDDMPLLGGIPQVEGLVLACGFSGHGFAIGPIIGKLLSQYIIDGKPELSLDAFRLTRFEEERKFSEEVYAYGQAVSRNR